MKNDDDHQKYSPVGHLHGHINGIQYYKYLKKHIISCLARKFSFDTRTQGTNAKN